jgi:hypothetical protein
MATKKVWSSRLNLEKQEGATGEHLPRFRVSIALSLLVISQREGATPALVQRESTTVDLEEAATLMFENS